MAINKGIGSSNALNERMKKYNLGKKQESQVISSDIDKKLATEAFGDLPSGTMTSAMRNRMAQYDSLKEVYDKVRSEDGIAKFNKNVGNIEKSYNFFKSQSENQDSRRLRIGDKIGHISELPEVRKGAKQSISSLTDKFVLKYDKELTETGNKLDTERTDRLNKSKDYSKDPKYKAMVEKGKTMMGTYGLSSPYSYKEYDPKVNIVNKLKNGKTVKDYLTSEQLNNLYYLKAKDKKEFDEYYDDLMKSGILQKIRDDDFAEITKTVQSNPFNGAAASMGYWTAGLIAGTEAIGEGIHHASNLITGSRIPYDRDSAYTITANRQNLNQAIRGGVDNPIGKGAVDVALSMGDTLARMPLGGGAGAVAGLTATSDDAYSKRNNGAGQLRTYLSATSVGAIEGLTESVSLGSLKAMASGGVTGAKAFLKNIAKQALVEGSEEVAAEILDTISDNAILGKFSDYNQNVQGYIDSGLSEDEAYRKAFKDKVKDVAYAGALGAVSGGVFGAGANVMSINNNINSFNQVPVYDFGELAAAVDTDEGHYRNTNDYKKALEAKRTFESFKGKNESNLTSWEKSVVESHLNELAAIEMGDDYTGTRGVDNDSYIQNNPTWNEALRQDSLDIGNSILNNIKNTTNYRPVNSINLRETFERQKSDNSANNNIASMDIRANQFAENGSRAYRANYDNKLPIDVYDEGFKAAYNVGRYGGRLANINNPYYHMLSLHQQEQAFEAGLRDMEFAKNQRLVYGDKRIGSFITGNDIGTKAQRELLKYIGKKTGLKVGLANELERNANGFYSRKAGMIMMSASAENFNADVSHELTHFIKDYAPDSYADFQNTVISYLAEQNNTTLEEMISEYSKRYEGVKSIKNREDIIDEITADSVADFLNDKEFIDNIAKSDKSITQKVIDFFQDIVDALDILITDVKNNKASKLLKESKERYEKARNLWADALDVASAEYKNGAEIEQRDESKEQKKYSESQINELGFKNYTTKEISDMANSKIKLIKSTDELEKFLYDSNIETAYIGKVGDKLAERVKNDIGIDIAGKHISITKSGINHIMKGHGTSKEVLRGQVKVELKDLLKVPYIITEYDNINYDSKNNRIIFNKTIDNIYTVVEAVTTKRNRLNTITMWINKKEVSHHAVSAKALPETPKTHVDMNPHEDTLLQNNKNINGKEQENEKFSLKKSVEETKDLIALHNLTPTNLIKTLKLGGIPMPSIAVTKSEIGHGNFGSISLVFDKNTIDPANKKNKVYSADAWTPTFPKLEYAADYEKANKIRSELQPYIDKLPNNYKDKVTSTLDTLYNNWNDYGGKDGFVEKFSNDHALKAAYLAKKGIEISEIKTETTDKMQEQDIEISKLIADKLGDNINDISDMKRTEVISNYGSKIREALLEYYQSVGDGNAIETVKTVKGVTLYNQFKKAVDYVNNKITSSKVEPDIAAMDAEIDKNIVQEDYTKWLKGIAKEIEADSGLYNGKELFTASGNRRSFKQLHLPFTVENIVKSMLAQGDGDAKNVTGFNGIKSIRASASTEFNSLDDIKAAKDKLQDLNLSQQQAVLENLEQRIYEIFDNIINNSANTGNRYSNVSNIGRIMLEASNAKKVTLNSVLKTFAPYNWKINEVQAKKIADLINDVKSMPVNLFEAKPERVVSFDEIKYAVVPNSESKVIEELNKLGIPVHEYEDGNEEQRKNILNDLDDVKFSIPQKNSDNETLTEEQKEYFKKGFKDSKGRLLKLYHGTPNGNFTVFKDWTYLTANKSYADIYHEPGASSISSGKEKINPKTYAVYARYNKVFDTRKAKERRIYEEEFNFSYGDGTPLMGKGLPDWTSGIDLIEFFEEEGYDYDAILLDEGGYPGDDGSVIDRGVSYVIKSSNQIKSIDNLTPTKDDDIRFSLSKNLSNDLDKILNQEVDASETELLIGTTSRVLTEILGAENHKVLMPVKKAYAAMVDEETGVKSRYYDKKVNYHNLGKEKVIKVLQASEDPVMILNPVSEGKGIIPNRLMIITDITDNNGKPIIVIQNVESDGTLNRKSITSNKVITIYDKKDIDYQIEHAAGRKGILYFNKEKSSPLASAPSVQFAHSLNKNELKENIQHFWNNVNYKNNKGGMKTKYTDHNASAGMSFKSALNSINLTGIDDHKNSLKLNSVKELVKKNEELKSINQELKRQFKLTKGYEPRSSDIERIASKMLTESNSTYDKAILNENLKRLYKYINKYEGQNTDEVVMIATLIAKDVLSKSKNIDSSAAKYHSKVLGMIRDYTLHLDSKELLSLTNLGTFDDIRKNYADSIELSRDEGLSVDEAYAELNEAYPHLFSDEITNSPDKLTRILDFIEETKPVVGNAYGLDIDQMANMLAEDMFNNYLDVRAAEPTFADKFKAELKAEREQHAKRLKEVKEGLIAKHKEEIRRLKSENRKRLEASLKKYNTEISNLKDIIAKSKDAKRVAELERELKKVKKARHNIIELASNVSVQEKMLVNQAGLSTISQLRNSTSKAINRVSQNPYIADRSEGEGYAVAGINKAVKAFIDKYGRIPEGINPVRDVKVPSQTIDDTKVRTTVRTILESDHISDEMVAPIGDELIKGAYNYKVLSDNKARDYALSKLDSLGYEGALDNWDGVAKGSNVATKNDIALAELLLKEASKRKDTKTVLKLTTEIAVQATRAGQVVQSIAMMKNLKRLGNGFSETADIMTFNKTVEAVNNDLNQKYSNKPIDKRPKVKLNEGLLEDFIKAESEADKARTREALIQNIADQIPATLEDKLNAWRYLAMLGNTKTHIRNLMGNALFLPVVRMKDIVATGLERAFIKNGTERTKAVFVKNEYKNFATKDLKIMKDSLAAGGKFNPTDEIYEKTTVFKNKLLEKVRKTNLDWLEKEDYFFLNRHYRHALGSYLQANNVNVKGKGVEDIDPNILNRAREYALNEAKKATYRDASPVASALSRFSREHKVVGIMLEGIMPFKKTPLNVAKRAVEYSPIGLVRTLTQGNSQLRHGKISYNEFIDNLAAGLTGSGLFALGYLMANLGFIGGDTDDKDKLMGVQKYSLKIGDYTYTLDWAAPAALVLFAGAEFNKELSQDEKVTPENVLGSAFSLTDPMLEMSFMSGISDLIDSIKYQEDPIPTAATMAMQSYLGSFVPSMVGQFTKTFDDTANTTYAEDNGIPRYMQTFWQRNVINKLPILANNYGINRIDEFGNTVSSGDFFERAFENFVSPGYLQKNKDDDVYNELLELYEYTKDKNVIPKYISKTINIKDSDGNSTEERRLTTAEFVDLQTKSGSLSYQLLDSLFDNPNYIALSNEEKTEVINKVYEYAKECAKEDVFDGYTVSSNNAWVKKAQSAKNAGMPVEDYIMYLMDTKDLEADKDINGNTIKDSKQKKVIEAIDKLNVTNSVKRHLWEDENYAEKNMPIKWKY